MAADRVDNPRSPGSEGILSQMVPTVADLKAHASLAFPVVVVQVGMMAMGVADTIMVGHLSARDLAAVALGNLYFFSAAVFGMGVLMALDPIVAQAVGAGDRVAISRGIQRGGLLALGLGTMAALVLLPGAPLFTLLNQPADVVPVAAGYAHAAIPGVFPFLAFMVLRQTLQAMGRVAPIVMTIVAANVANLFFNWVLIYGNLGMPSLGAVGSGWASSLSRWLMLVTLLTIAWPLVGPYLRPFRRDALLAKPLFRMVRLGTPIGIQFGLEYGAFAAIGILMGWLGTVAMAGHQVAINLASLTFMVPLGISQASAVLVGQGVGRGDPAGARRSAGAGILLGAAFMTLTAVTFLSIPHLFARVYTSQREVVELAVLLIPIAGLFQIFDGLQVVSSGVLRGVGDTRSPMVVSLVGFWLIGMPVSLVMAFWWGAGPIGLWWGLVAGLGAVAVFLLVRVGVRFGRDLRRILIDDDTDPTPMSREETVS